MVSVLADQPRRAATDTPSSPCFRVRLHERLMKLPGSTPTLGSSLGPKIPVKLLEQRLDTVGRSAVRAKLIHPSNAFAITQNAADTEVTVFLALAEPKELFGQRSSLTARFAISPRVLLVGPENAPSSLIQLVEECCISFG